MIDENEGKKPKGTEKENRESNIELLKISEKEPKTLEEEVKINAPEVKKGAGIVMEEGKKYKQDLKNHGADDENLREFVENQEVIERELGAAEKQYEGDIEVLQKDIPNMEDKIEQIKKIDADNKIINNNKNMEKAENNGGRREEKILGRLEEIRKEKEQFLNSKMEQGEIRLKLELLEKEERELKKEFSAISNIGVVEEKATGSEMPIADVKEERLSEKELQEMEEIIKEADTEMAFLKVSNGTREEKIESVEKQLSILKEILPKFHKDNYKELDLFRKANGLYEQLLQLKKEPYLLD